MHVLRYGITVLALAAATANADIRAPADLDPVVATPGAKVVFACASMESPRLSDVAEVVGTRYDIWASFVARQRLVAMAKPVCDRGIDVVQFVPTVTGASESRYAMTSAGAP